MSASIALIVWVGREVLPHEPALRRWLRSVFPNRDIDDVVQETYCRLSMLDSFDHITDPRSYLFQTARNVVFAELRREKIVRIETVGSAADLDHALREEFDALTPERITAGRRLLLRIEKALSILPTRSRRIFMMRKVDGLSQREIARMLGVSETVVENDLSRGVRAILASLSDDEREALPVKRKEVRHGRPRIRERH